MVAVAQGWQLAAKDAGNNLLGIISGYTSLRFVVRRHRGGTWQLTAPEGTGVELLAPGTRLQVRRQTPSRTLTYSQLAASSTTYTALASTYSDYATIGLTPSGSTIVAEGYVTRIEDEINERGRVLEVSGITDTGLLADRLTLPTPWAEFTAQNVDAYWTESGPAEFIIHRLITRNAGLGALPDRQLIDSRVGTEVRVAPQKTAAGWTEVSTAGVTWAGNVATVNQNSTAAFRMTDAINLGTTDMATLVSHLDVSGECNFVLYGHFNTTAAGAAPGQAGVVTEQYLGTKNTADRILWAAEAFRTRNSGKGWVRLQINVQAKGAQRTVEFLPEGGVFQKAMSGSTVTVNTRFKNLSEEVEELAQAGGVVIYSDTANDMPRVLVRAGVDRTDEIRLSRAYGNVLSYNTVQAAPAANVVMVAGEGEGTARVTASRSDTASQTEWGRRIEKFRDARDVDAADTTLLNQRGDEELEESARTSGWLVESIDNQGMRWPDNYDVGDEVTVLTRDVEATDVVAAVEVLIDRDGVVVKPILGSSELADNEPGLYAAVRDLRKRLEQLEGRV